MRRDVCIERADEGRRAQSSARTAGVVDAGAGLGGWGRVFEGRVAADGDRGDARADVGADGGVEAGVAEDDAVGVCLAWCAGFFAAAVGEDLLAAGSAGEDEAEDQSDFHRGSGPYARAPRTLICSVRFDPTS